MSEEIKVLAGQERPDYTEELLTLLRSRRPIAELRLEMEDYHDGDLADLLEQLQPADRRRMYRILGLDRMSDVFAYLEDVGLYIEELDAEIAADIIEGMDADDAVDVLDELDEEKIYLRETDRKIDQELKYGTDGCQRGGRDPDDRFLRRRLHR